ncbi:MAG: anaerobic ribonucleoside-triphosphate reductase activating protein [Anaerolineae bacterium]
MKIAGLQRVSLIDYPGRIAATIFLAGCNLDCGYCHNRWMITESAVQEALSVSELLAWLTTRVNKLQGVCISGGEPLVHTDLEAFIRSIKQLGFRVKLDTNGTLPVRLGTLLATGLVDYIAMDIKGPLTSRYEHFSGYAKADQVRKSMQLLRAGSTPYEFRTTVCPDMTEVDLEDIAAQLNPEERWYLQPYRAAETVLESWRNRETMSLAKLFAFVTRMQARLPLVQVRGEEIS